MEYGIISHGGHYSNDYQLKLKAGRLSMIYENGSLRRICCGNREILRMIYMAVRSSGWITIKPQIKEEEPEVLPESFIIRYVAYYDQAPIRFVSKFKLQGFPDNSLEVSFDGEAQEEFMKNRIGFCVLHPPEGLTGKECIVTSPGGKTVAGSFPDLISPHQPFKDISAMQWKINGLICKLEFSGDVFETEDQRNWTDASFKTYSTPLSLPYPVKVMKGKQISQRVRLSVRGTEIQNANPVKNLISVEASKSVCFPFSGIARSTREEPMTGNEIKILEGLKFDHYRIDIYLFEPGWEKTAGIAAFESSQLGYKLELALFFDVNYKSQLKEFVDWLKIRRPDVSTVILYDKDLKVTPDSLSEAVIPAIRIALPGVIICTGTNRNFAQLNRERPVSQEADCITYAIHPQEHADDNLTLIENLEAQKHTVESARAIAGDKKSIWVSPVNIQRRFNANTENYEVPGESETCPPQVDSRMMSLLGASWTAISMKYLYEAGVKGITWHQTVGERGIMQGDFPSRWPECFPAGKGMIFPVFHVFRFISDHRSFRTAICESSNPLVVNAFTITDGVRIEVILTNFTSEIQEATIEGINKIMSVHSLDHESFHEASGDPLWLGKAKDTKTEPGNRIVLKPYSINFMECIV